jgi:hypothetical protein
MSPEADAAEVVRRELALLDRSVRAEPDVVLGYLHPEFREVGASGRVWDRATIAARLAADDDETPILATELAPVVLAPCVVLLTYTVLRAGRISHRSSIWLLVDGAWLLRHHQGTLAPES